MMDKTAIRSEALDEVHTFPMFQQRETQYASKTPAGTST
jgi:hypothetical protein